MDHDPGVTRPERLDLQQTAQNRDRRTILIAGAGIGGLAAALALARHGIASHVLERRPSFSAEGAGIQIGPNGGHVLAWLGLAEKLRGKVGVPDAIRVHSGRSGEALSHLPLGSRLEQRLGAPYWVAHRSDLHGVLLEAVRSSELITLTLDAGVTGVRQDQSGVCVEIAGARRFEGAGLIAADGLWSDLRTQLFGARELVYSGRCAARAVLPAASVPGGLQLNDVGVWLAPNAHVVHYPVRGGRELALVVVHEAAEAVAGWNGELPAEQVREFARGFAPVLRELIGAVPAWRRWGLYDVPEALPSTQGRVALLGDAAHPILPFLAQGGVMALEDGLTLAQSVAGHDDISQAFAAYQAARSRRTARVQAASRRNGRIYHLAGPAAGARNMALRAVPGSLLMAQYDWLYGWRPRG